jgi:membrane fusion protein, multidrug efflux system
MKHLKAISWQKSQALRALQAPLPFAAEPEPDLPPPWLVTDRPGALVRRVWFYALLLLFCAASWGCSGNGSKPTSARAAGPQTVPVGVATAERRDFPEYLTGLGSVLAFNTVSIKSRVDGQLVEVNFKEGQNVKKGELLALIDPRPYEVQLSQAQAQLFKDQASLRDAKLNYQRFKDLLQQSGAMSQQQVDTQLATADQLEGAVRADQAQVDNAKLNLVYCHITTPISGRIGIRLVDPGNMVHASDANPLLVVTQLQPITALFTLPEDQLPEVARRMARGSLQVDAYSRDDQTKLATGKLLTIDNTIDQSTGTGRLKAVFENTESSLWPNQFVNIRLLLDIKKDATVVPAAAIQRGPQGGFVYAVKPDKTVEVRPVTVALTQNNVAAIASGLSPGDVVVTDGQDKLQAGTKVEPRPETTLRPAKPAQSSATGTQ